MEEALVPYQPCCTIHFYLTFSVEAKTETGVNGTDGIFIYLFIYFNKLHEVFVPLGIVLAN